MSERQSVFIWPVNEDFVHCGACIASIASANINQIAYPRNHMAKHSDNDRNHLYDVATDEVRRAGFSTSISDEVRTAIEQRERDAPKLTADALVRDMRELLWCSIDNDDSRDLDQVQCAEQLDEKCIRLLVGIADVDEFVRRDDVIDRHAAHNATSVYTGVRTFPMLPDQLSEGITSLLPGTDRLAVVTALTLDFDGNVVECEAWRALVRNRAKLVYESIGAWLDRGGTPPHGVEQIDGLEAQLLLQYEATERLERYRTEHGALNLETIEARPVTRDGRIVDLVVREENPARELIENLMVAANNAVAEYLRSRGVPTIQRIVREPARWPQIVELAASRRAQLPENPDARALTGFLESQRRKDPVRFPDLSLAIVKLLGAAEYDVVMPDEAEPTHFALALRGYSRSTAPNRRYVDLITQRMLKAAVASATQPYSVDELEDITAHCREMERSARKVERRVRKIGAAMLLSDRIGQEFEGIVTGASSKGTYVRLFSPPAEGRVVRNYDGMNIGQKVRVQLIGTEAEKGFIDFAGV